MASPQSSVSFKRPPIFQVGSSPSSSLSGLEMAIPSFQEFIRRTPSPDKPLPPTPLRTKPPSASQKSSYTTRRSSSVYSRDINGVTVPTERLILPSWRTADFAEQNLLLRPIPYSASTSKLPDQSLPTLAPRTYNPLVRTPSPTTSRKETPSPPQVGRPSVLLPPPVGVVQVPKKHLRTVSLEKARELLQARRTSPLLPEELRARTHTRSRSQDLARTSSSRDIAAGSATPPAVPENPTLIDHQGRERIVSSPMMLSALVPVEDPFRAMESPIVQARPSRPTIKVGDGPVRDMVPLAAQARTKSRAKAAQALGLAEADERRGRTKTRSPRNLSYEHYLPNFKPPSDADDDYDDLKSDAQKIAEEYHAVLSEQYRQASCSGDSGSSVDVRTHMKLVPQTLFHQKPTPRMQDQFTGREIVLTLGQGSEVRASSSNAAFSSARTGATDSLHRRGSTSGSIPISLTSETLPSNAISNRYAAQSSALPLKRQMSRFGSRPSDSRVSEYYPHVMPRKAKTAVAKRRSTDIQKATVGGILKHSGRGSGDTLHSSTASARSSSSKPSHSRVRPRMFRDVFKQADDISTQNGQRSTSRRRSRAIHKPSSASSDISPSHHTSPHLLLTTPAPGSNPPSPPTFHLGWTDNAKSAFDSTRTLLFQSSSRKPQVGGPVLTHVQPPARPLDETKSALRDETDGSSPVDGGAGVGRRNGSLSVFTGMLEGWREGKAEKRREELRRLIRVVTSRTDEESVDGGVSKAEEGNGGTGRGGGGVGGMGLGRRLSGFTGWM